MEQAIQFLQSDAGIKALTVFSVILVILLISTLLKRVVPRYIAETGSRYRARKFINFFAYLLIIICILIVFSNQLTGFSVFLGVAGAGVAFALQEVIASAAGFIVIHSSNFYKVGDRVLLGGIKGDVIDIGVLRTSLMEMGDWVKGDLYNGRITRVANSFVFKEPVYNYSGNFPFLWDEINVPIKTDGDLDYAREQFLGILNEIQGTYVADAQKYWAKMTEAFMIEKAKVDPFVSMEFDANWTTFTLRYVVDYKARRTTKDLISQRVLRSIRESDGKIVIASTSFEITYPGN